MVHDLGFVFEMSVGLGGAYWQGDRLNLELGNKQLIWTSLFSKVQVFCISVLMLATCVCGKEEAEPKADSDSEEKEEVAKADSDSDETLCFI